MYSNLDSETMSFDYFNYNENKVYESISSIEFDGDMILGDVVNPYVVNTYDQIPEHYSLGMAYPNPFNPSTNFEFSLSENGHINISVFDINGRLVSKLLDDYKLSGEYGMTWDASGSPSGVYFITMMVNGYSSTQKVMLIK
jgi:hypothetical protein